MGDAYHSAGINKSSDPHASIDEQIANLEQAVYFRLETLGELHPLTASSYKFLGKCYHEKREYNAALKFMKRALRIYIEVLGLHPAAAVVMSDLGKSMQKMKEVHDAIRLYEQALNIFKNTLGTEHPDAAKVISKMSTAYLLLGQHDQAYDFGEKAIHVCKIVFGPKHRKTIRAEDSFWKLQQQEIIRGEDTCRQPSHHISKSKSMRPKLNMNFKLSGVGTFPTSSSQDDSIFVQFRQGTYQGQWKYDTGPHFVGCSEEGCQHGYGVFTYDNGYNYAGYWKDGKKHGRGKYICGDGVFYEGHFKEDKMHGHGVRRYLNGEEHVGRWENDQLHGQGKLVFCDGQFYEGNFDVGAMRGHGVRTYSDGRRYEGMFEKGKRHGLGKMSSEKGFTYEGLWDNDEKCDVELVIGNGVYKGPFKNDLANGRGVFTQTTVGYAFGSKYEGHKGDKYEGEWYNHKRNGQGKCLFGLTGQEFQCKWENGSSPEFESHQRVLQSNSEPDATVKKGSRVCIEGLQSKPELNGRTGTVLEARDQMNDRWTVQLDGMEISCQFSIRSVNLKVTFNGDQLQANAFASEPAPRPFQKPRFRHLVSAVHSLLVKLGFTSYEKTYLVGNVFDASIHPNPSDMKPDDPKAQLVAILSAYPSMFQLHDIDKPGIERVHAKTKK